MPPSTLRWSSLVDSAGKRVILGSELGRGGEGSVFDAPTAGPDRVIKIYHDPVKPAKQDKLRAMVLAQAADLLHISTWPVDTVHEARTGQVVGFVMPKLSGYDEIHALYSPAQRKREYPFADWAFLVRAARNAAAAIATFHQRGHVIGDINPNNLVFSKTATVKLIDCDSFQITANGRRYLCEVGVPHFTPPELHGKSFSNTVRTPNHDGFGLALLCFHLLFMGRHPFAGKYHNGTHEMPIERAIREFRFAYSASAATKQMTPPPNTLGLDVVPETMRHLFERAFGEQGALGRRPSAAQWVQALEALEQNLVECSVLAMHKYDRDLAACPWCTLEARSGVLFFIPKLPARRAAFDLDAVWNQILAVTPPASAVLPQFRFTPVARLVSLPAGATAKQALAIYKREHQTRQTAFVTAKRQWEQTQAQWAQHLADKTFDVKRAQLQQLRDNYQSLRQQYQAARRQLQQKARTLQLEDYLDRFFIERAKISGIGPTRSAILASYGVETAADVTPRIINIPGFGPTLTQELLTWRSTLEKRFVFDPKKVGQLSGIARLEGEFLARSAPLEKALSNGKAELEAIRQAILARRQALILEAERHTQAYEQAKADVEHVAQEVGGLRKQAIREQWLVPLVRVVAPMMAVVVLVLALYTAGPSLATIASGIIAGWRAPQPTVVLPDPTPTPPQTPPSPLPSPTSTRTPLPRTGDRSPAAGRAPIVLTAWVYPTPDASGDAFASLDRGAVVDVIGRANSNTWCRIRLDDGQEGWVYCVLLEIEIGLDRLPVLE